ncbi:MAG: cytidylate kinase-like family protein [Lachnospiraceae bacterium]|nr:cytidylate kinase-like family protein [Lachnospiraceae bacterium]
MEKMTVTIARQYGSSGRMIGRKLADQMKIHYYDRELLRLASNESGIDEELFYKADEKLKKTFFDLFARKKYKESWISPDSDEFTSDDNLFNFQAKIIRELAQKESCVIIGRCADFILRERKDVVRVYLHAPFEERLKAVLALSPLSEEEARKQMEKTDRLREEYYAYYTGRNWHSSDNYDLCIDTSRVGVDECVEMIARYMEAVRSGKGGM